jgi:hypothetical protein
MPQSALPAALAASVLGLTLLAAGCSSGGGSGDQKSGGSSAAAATGIQIPARIGKLTKLAGNDQLTTLDTTIPKSVLKNLHDATYYTDVKSVSSPHVEVRGGPGMPYPSDGPTDKIKRLFSAWDLSVDVDKAFKVPAGSVGGQAECTTTSTDKTYFACGWISGKIALVIDFNKYNREKVTALLPKVLEAMVTS